MNVRQQLIDTMKTLIEKYPIEKINVDMILENSSISRATFYRYFPDKYALMHAYYVHFIESMMIEDDYHVQQNFERLLEFILQNKLYFTKLIKFKGDDDFFLIYYKISCKYLEARVYREKGEQLNEDELYAISFFSAGSSYCIEKWVEEGMKMSSQKLAKIIHDNLPPNISDYYV